MAPRQLSALAFLVLAACPREVIQLPRGGDEPPASSPLLAAGSYVVTVDDVAAMSCEGAAPRELIGQQIGAQIRVGEDEVVVDLGGWLLRGDMVPGAIFVEGTEDVDVVVDDEETDVDDEDRDDDTDVDEPGASAEGGSSEEGVEGVEDRRSDCGEGEPGEEEVPTDDPYVRGDAFAALDAQILDNGHAEGRLTLIMADCAMELEVRVEAGEVDAPVVREESESSEPPDPSEDREGGSSGSGGSEEDCG